jgi:hypothetical protein
MDLRLDLSDLRAKSDRAETFSLLTETLDVLTLRNYGARSQGTDTYSSL